MTFRGWGRLIESVRHVHDAQEPSSGHVGGLRSPCSEPSPRADAMAIDRSAPSDHAHHELRDGEEVVAALVEGHAGRPRVAVAVGGAGLDDGSSGAGANGKRGVEGVADAEPGHRRDAGVEVPPGPAPVVTAEVGREADVLDERRMEAARSATRVAEGQPAAGFGGRVRHRGRGGHRAASRGGGEEPPTAARRSGHATIQSFSDDGRSVTA